MGHVVGPAVVLHCAFVNKVIRSTAIVCIVISMPSRVPAHSGWWWVVKVVVDVRKQQIMYPINALCWACVSGIPT